MAVLETETDPQARLIAERRRCGADRFDEVWEGRYVMAPLPNDEHQELHMNFGAAIKDALGWDSLAKVRAGVNVSDRNEDWVHNYRCPDVVVFLPENNSINRGTHWQGGPDFLIEVVSEGDRSHEKLLFYSNVAVREVLIVERNPWTLELYNTKGSSGALQLTGAAIPDDNTVLRSNVLPAAFELRSGHPRPRIHLTLLGTEAERPGRARMNWVI